MKQLGHFMMASVKLGGFNLVLSGTYGSDGLPVNFGQHFVDHEPARFTETGQHAFQFDGAAARRVANGFLGGRGPQLGRHGNGTAPPMGQGKPRLLRRPIKTPARLPLGQFNGRST